MSGRLPGPSILAVSWSAAERYYGYSRALAEVTFTARDTGAFFINGAAMLGRRRQQQAFSFDN
jgi:hypothetical protein